MEVCPAIGPGYGSAGTQAVVQFFLILRLSDTSGAQLQLILSENRRRPALDPVERIMEPGRVTKAAGWGVKFEPHHYTGATANQ